MSIRRGHRRALLLAVAVVGTLLPGVSRAGAAAFEIPLRMPPVITDSDITLDALEADVQIMPDGQPATRMWTYNGTFPGPTIRRPAGQQTRVTLRNRLSGAGDLTMHLHGGHTTSEHDGQPSSHLIPEGSERTYVYDLLEGTDEHGQPMPERGAMQWYHDHAMDVTARNVWMGLAGMFIIDDPAEDALNLPSGDYDVPLMIVDREFDANNQIPYSFDIGGVNGRTILVNGTPQPHFKVRDRKYRLRILNASNERSYDLALDNGRPMLQIGSDGGLLPEAVARTNIVLGPAERAEVVIDFAGLQGSRIRLRNNLGFGTTLDVMRFDVELPHEPDTSQVPLTLREAPSFDWSPPQVARTWVLGQTSVPTTTWTINGLGFDHHRVDTAPLHPRLDTVERWIFVNATPAPHLMHIHDVDWRIVRRTIASPDGSGVGDAGEDGLKETFFVRGFETVEVETRFTDHLGLYVFHCHILEHEDRAMMAQFMVVEDDAPVNTETIPLPTRDADPFVCFLHANGVRVS